MIFNRSFAVFRFCGFGFFLIIFGEGGRIVEVITGVYSHPVYLAGRRIHCNRLRTGFAAGFDCRLFEIIFENALDFIVNRRNEACAVRCVDICFIIVRHRFLNAVLRRDDLPAYAGKNAVVIIFETVASAVRAAEADDVACEG